MTVKAGDKLQFPGCPEAVVTRVSRDEIFGNVTVHYHYPGSEDEPYSTTLLEAEDHLVKDEYPYGEPFPTGSIVQFKRTRYRVEDFDGEHHNLVAVDPEEDRSLNQLYFSPDMFELVRPPFPEVHSVWEDRNDYRVYVKRVDVAKNLVWIQRFNGHETGISVEQMHDRYTQVL